MIKQYKLTKEFFKHRKVFEADGVTIQEIPDDDIPFGLMNPNENDPYSHLFDYESESDLEFSEEDSSETSDDTDSEDSSEMSDDDDYDEEEDKNNALESAEDGSKKDFVIAGKKLLFFSLF